MKSLLYVGLVSLAAGSNSYAGSVADTIAKKGPKWIKSSYLLPKVAGVVSTRDVWDSKDSSNRIDDGGLSFSPTGMKLCFAGESPRAFVLDQVFNVTFTSATSANGAITGTCRVEENLLSRGYTQTFYRISSAGTYRLNADGLKLDFNSTSGKYWIKTLHGVNSGRVENFTLGAGEFKSHLVLTPITKGVRVRHTAETSLFSTAVPKVEEREVDSTTVIGKR